MQAIHERTGQAIEVEDSPIGFGGLEGAIHRFVQNPGLAVKIFNGGVNGERRERIEHFLSNPVIPTGSGYDFASPQALVLDPQSSEAVGYVLAFVEDAMDLEDLYTWAPALDKRFVIRVAHNLTKGLIELHAAGGFQRDFPNEIVTRNGHVTKIDVDSYHVGSRLIAETGKEHALPPEILKVAVAEWQDTPCSKEQDAWSLAIVLWKLLRQDGHHPFDIHYTGTADCLDLCDRILQGWFPYSGATHPDYTAPTGAAPLSDMELSLRQFFKQMFVDGHSFPSKRPSLEYCGEILSDLDDGGDVTLPVDYWESMRLGVSPGSPLTTQSPASRGLPAFTRKSAACGLATTIAAVAFWSPWQGDAIGGQEASGAAAIAHSNFQDNTVPFDPTATDLDAVEKAQQRRQRRIVQLRKLADYPEPGAHELPAVVREILESK